MPNPFSPSFGVLPHTLIARNGLITDYLNDLEQPASEVTSTLIYGFRGSGKTSLLTEISRQLDTKNNWITIPLNITDTIATQFASDLANNLPASFTDILKTVKELNLGFAKLEDPTSDQTVFTKIGNLLETYRQKNVKILITIDEVRATNAFRDFIEAYQIWLRKGYPVHILMAGLPHKIFNLQKDKRLTFLLRAHTIQIGNLPNEDILDAYLDAFSNDAISYQEAMELTKLANGYPYAFQLLESLAYKYGFKNINQFLPEFKSRLARNVLSIIEADVSKTDLAFLTAIAKSKTGLIKDIIPLFADGNKTNQYRNRMLAAGLITTTARGKLEFTVPYLGDYLLNPSDYIPF